MKWTNDSKEFRSECLEIAKDLRGFKRNPIYSKIVGMDMKDAQFCEGFQRELTAIKYRSDNDKIGDPRLSLIRGHWVAGATLHYMWVKKQIGNVSSIAEIGGGYGGQRLIFNNVEHYSIFDIPENLEVIKSYLKKHNLKLTPFNKAELCLSCFALSEFDDDLQQDYIDRVVSKCSRMFFIGEADDMTRLAAKLPRSGSLRAEFPRTSLHVKNLIYEMGIRN